jgi:hypothetical protein
MYCAPNLCLWILKYSCLKQENQSEIPSKQVKRSLRIVTAVLLHHQYKLDKIDQNRVISCDFSKLIVKVSSWHQVNNVTVTEYCKDYSSLLLSKVGKEQYFLVCISLNASSLIDCGKCQVEWNQRRFLLWVFSVFFMKTYIVDPEKGILMNFFQNVPPSLSLSKIYI